jgi:4-carboxymuconolactone decarboxylase
MSDPKSEEGPGERRRRGLERMAEVYGWEFKDGPGDFFGYTADHLFADIWNRPGLSTRDRRLLLIGLLAGTGQADVLGIQVPAAYRNGELDEAALREIVIFLCHYAGWPVGARLDNVVETAIAKGRD